MVDKSIIATASAQLLSGSNEALLRKRRTLAAYHAKLILGSYRADQAGDPEIYVTAVSHLLSRYPADIGARLTDPKDGIAGSYKWLPSVSEVRDEAEKLMAADSARWKRARDLEEQFAERDRLEQEEEKAESTEHRERVAKRILAELKEAFAAPAPEGSYAAMVAKHGRPRGAFEEGRQHGYATRKAVDIQRERENLHKYGATNEQIDALPKTNAKEWDKLSKDATS